jgi:hypothetical protein
MAHRPVEKATGKKRPVTPDQAAKLKRQKEKADWHNRNPDSKWNKR